MDYLAEILKDTYSVTSLKHRLRILKSYISNHLFGNQKEEIAAGDTSWLSTLSPLFYQQFNTQNVNEIFIRIDTQINKFKILTMFLPFEANEQTIKEIGQYSRKAFHQMLLLDIKFDPNLSAGCALTWNGVYKDYSLRAKIQERKDDILESFKRFLQ